MGMNAGKLNRRIQIQRGVRAGHSGGVQRYDWLDHGPSLFAARKDVSDAERLIAARWDNKLVSRFVIRSTAFGRGIRRSDRIVHEGITYEITGIKEVPPGRAFLEITAEAEEVS